MIIDEVLQLGEKSLSESGVTSARIEVEVLLAGLLNASPTQMHLLRPNEVANEVTSRFEDLVKRRALGEPVAYLLGRQNFWGRDFLVNHHVLIPRPETELLVERAVKEMAARGKTNPRILDLGTGSGCIAVTLAHFLPEAVITAIDISEEALAVAKLNAQLQKKDRQIRFLTSDMYAAIDTEKEGVFDMIAANPPYISDSDLKQLEREVLCEPLRALAGGSDGLFLMRRLVAEAPRYLAQDGVLLAEIGFSQAAETTQIFRASGFKNIGVQKDYAGHDRIVVGELNGSI